MRKGTLAVADGASRDGTQGWERTWIEAFATHAARRFETRALVKVSVHGEEPAALSYVYALEGGGLVLVVEGGEAPPHHGELAHAAHDGHDDDREAETHHEPGARAHEDPEAAAHDELWNLFRGTGVKEIWIASPDQAVFHVERAAEGELSTGFGVLGLSRTPQLLTPRSATTPVRVKGHQHP